MTNKLISVFFLVIGYLLSPLCWWNDLFFNLPLAFLGGRGCSVLNQGLFLPCSISFYWLSNIVGMLLIQKGAVEFVPKQSSPRNLKKELLSLIISSTLYTTLIIILMYFNIIDNPVI